MWDHNNAPWLNENKLTKAKGYLKRANHMR